MGHVTPNLRLKRYHQSRSYRSSIIKPADFTYFCQLELTIADISVWENTRPVVESFCLKQDSLCVGDYHFCLCKRKIIDPAWRSFPARTLELTLRHSSFTKCIVCYCMHVYHVRLEPFRFAQPNLYWQQIMLIGLIICQCSRNFWHEAHIYNIFRKCISY